MVKKTNFLKEFFYIDNYILLKKGHL